MATRKNRSTAAVAGYEDIAVPVNDSNVGDLGGELRKAAQSAGRITSCPDTESLTKTLLDELAALLGAAGGSVYFLRADTLEYGYALDAAHMPQSIALPLREDSPFQRALDTCEMVFTTDIAATADLSGSGWGGYQNNSFVVYPILGGNGEITALVALHDSHAGRFAEHNCELGKILSSFGAQALRVLESAETLRDSEHKLARLMANLPGMAYQRSADEAWTMRFVSDGCAALTGYVPEAMINNRGVQYLDLIHPDDREWVVNEVQQAVAANRGFRIIYRIFTARGDSKWVWELGAPVLSRNGKSMRIEGFVTDVTDWKRAEDERSRLAMAIEQSVESVVILDALGIIEYVNPAYEHHSGYTSGEAIGKDLKFLYAGHQDEKFFEVQWSRISQGEVWTGVVTNRQKDGTHYNEQVSISSVRDGSGNIVYFVATSKDITKETRLETQLRQAHKMEAIGELAAGVAHEINTPTQYIGDNIRFFQESFEDLRKLLAAYAELAVAARSAGVLEEEAALAEKVVQEIDLEYLVEELPTAIEQSLEGNRRVAEIVRAMKEFAHPGSDEKTGIDVNRAIKSTVSVARNEWRYVADVETNLDSELGLVPGHASSFNQVILNLIVNAAHAIGDVLGENPSEKGKIQITTEAQADWAVIHVRDSGTGIPESVKSHIFDPFFTTKQPGKGTGHGLAVAHSVIVEQHDGIIEVDSTPGEGTCFILRLPMHSPDES